MQKLSNAPRIEISFSAFLVLMGLVVGFSLSFYYHCFEFWLVLFVFLFTFFVAVRKGKKSVGLFLAGIFISIIAFYLLQSRSEVNQGTYTGIVCETRNNYFLFSCNGTRYYVYEKNQTHECGDILQIVGRIENYVAPTYESRFSFSDYLHRNGVEMEIQIKKITCLWERPLRLRKRELSFLASFPSTAASLIDSILFDCRDYHDSSITKASALGVLYFLSASGALYGVFLRVIEKVLELKLDKRRSAFVAFLIGAIVLPFLIRKIGVWRVFLTRAFCLPFIWQQKTPPWLSSLGFAGILLWLINPFNSLNMGFLVGFGIAYSFALSRPFLSVLFAKRKKTIGYVLSLLFVLPLLINQNAFHLLAFSYPFIFLPIIYPFAFLALLSFLSLPAVTLLSSYASFIRGVINFFSQIDIPIPTRLDQPVALFVYYVFLVAFLALLTSGISEVAHKVAIGLACFVALSCLPLGTGALQQVSFINVGQGDAILIRDGYTSIMIDTGGNLSFDMAVEVDIPFLRKEGIHQLNAVIASHGDFDHIGALNSLTKHFPVKTCIRNSSAFPLSVGSLHFTNYNRYGIRKTENDKSLVLEMNFMQKRWLFTGDCPSSIEEKIVEDNPYLKIDILKVAHHGSASSSSLEFLRAINPKVGIISVGKKNKYGHPSKEVLKRFSSLHIPVRRTDEEGTITYRRFIIRPFMKFISEERREFVL